MFGLAIAYNTPLCFFVRCRQRATTRENAMLLEEYYLRDGDGIAFTREQASRFAKAVAGDFNPLHDVAAKRFCVPGDLLFAVVVAEKGLHQRMAFQFSGMVTDGVTLHITSPETGQCALVDDADKGYLLAECDGEVSHDEALLHDLIYNYVEFSGKTFPHILVPLLEKKQVMINPKRPMVIYERMEISLDRIDLDSLDLEFSDATIDVNGKRGEVFLLFDLMSDGVKVGQGKKKMLLSGLQPYDADVVAALVDDFNRIKDGFDAANPSL